MRRNALRETDLLDGLLQCLRDSCACNGFTQPSAREQQGASRTRCLPVSSERIKQDGTKHHITLTTAFGVPDADDHPLGVDVAGFELGDLAHAKPRTIGEHRHRSMLGTLDRAEEPLHLCPAQDRGQPHGDLHSRQAADLLGTIQSNSVEEADGSTVHVERRWTDLPCVLQIQKELPDLRRT